MAALAAKLNTFLETHSYLGDDVNATKEDYRVCASISSVDENAHPHLARWHSHVSHLMAKFPNYDWRGCPVPAGKDRAGAGGAPAASSSPKSSPKKEAAPAPAPKKAAAAPAPAATGAVNEDAIKAVGDEIRVLKERLKGEGVTGKKLNDHPEVVAAVAKLNELKGGGGATASASPKQKPAAAPKEAASPKQKPAKEAAPKEAAAKKGDKKEKGKKEEAADAAPTPEQLAEARKKQLKTVIKEGGKRGVEIEGAADMGGLQFFCTAVDAPEGDLEMLEKCIEAMNAKSDPTEEERKGGSGHIGKMIFSAGTAHLAIGAYVPEAKQGECSCEEWLKTVLAAFNGEVVKAGKSVSIGKVNANSDKGIFPLKIREPLIIEANNFLRKRGLFPEDKDSDDDEYVFGDDDFPSM